jgi:hypothetical protein
MSDKQKCPLCDQPNRCAMAEGESVSVCWCASIRLTVDMLEAVPSEHRGVRCICATCARALASGVAPNQSLQLTAGRRDDELEFMKHIVDVAKARFRQR